jgi:hypothetical protein
LGKTGTIIKVFGVGHNKIKFVMTANLAEIFSNSQKAGLSDYIPEKQELHMIST